MHDEDRGMTEAGTELGTDPGASPGTDAGAGLGMELGTDLGTDLGASLIGDTVDEPLDDEALIALARDARERAYAPYSSYRVGCALRAGVAVFSGANVENASYGLTLCAERTALVQAVLAGVRELDTVVVLTSSNPPASPCGMCLQSLIEFCSDPANTRVILVNDLGQRRDLSLAELLPHAFTPRQLHDRSR